MAPFTAECYKYKPWQKKYKLREYTVEKKTALHTYPGKDKGKAVLDVLRIGNIDGASYVRRILRHQKAVPVKVQLGVSVPYSVDR